MLRALGTQLVGFFKGRGQVTRTYRQQHLDLDRARTGVPYYRVLENVLVDTVDWSIMTESGVIYSRDTHGRNLAKSPWIRGRISPDGETVVASYPRPRIEIAEECIFVGGDENYSHWVFRNLPKLAAVQPDGLIDRLPWLLNRNLMPWQLELLDMFGVAPGRRVLVDRGSVIRCRRIIVPALLTSTKGVAAGTAWMRGRLRAYLQPQGEARIYVARSDARVRRVLNERELYDRLQPLGFDFVVPGALSVTEQIRVFSGARMIVGVHGAALTNIIFSPSDAVVFEINSTAKVHMEDFRRIARARGQRMTTIVSERYADPPDAVHSDSDYYVDVEQVLREVAPCLDSAPTR